MSTLHTTKQLTSGVVYDRPARLRQQLLIWLSSWRSGRHRGEGKALRPCLGLPGIILAISRRCFHPPYQRCWPPCSTNDRFNLLLVAGRPRCSVWTIAEEDEKTSQIQRKTWLLLLQHDSFTSYHVTTSLPQIENAHIIIIIIIIIQGRKFTDSFQELFSIHSLSFPHSPPRTGPSDPARNLGKRCN